MFRVIITAMRYVSQRPLQALVEEIEGILEGKIAKVGEKRKWKSGWVERLQKGWKKLPNRAMFSTKNTPTRYDIEQGHVPEAEQKAKKEADAKEALSLLAQRGDDADRHLAITTADLAKQKSEIGDLKDRLQHIVDRTGGEVFGRVKDLGSTLKKLVEKPKYKNALELTDTTGTRIVCKTMDEAKAAIAELRKGFDVVEEEDNLVTPREGGYRSYHALVMHGNPPQRKEVQIRTANQDAHGNWAHDSYKPRTKVQRAVLANPANSNIIKAYGALMSEWFHDRDTGQRRVSKPACPPVVRQHFGCL